MKYGKRGKKIEHLLNPVKERSQNIETKNQGKKYVTQICFILILQEFNKYYYRLTEMEHFPLTYSRMVVSSSGHSESSMSNQLLLKETSNTNKKNNQHKFAVQLRNLLEKNCSRKLKRLIVHLVKF